MRSSIPAAAWPRGRGGVAPQIIAGRVSPEAAEIPTCTPSEMDMHLDSRKASLPSALGMGGEARQLGEDEFHSEFPGAHYCSSDFFEGPQKFHREVVQAYISRFQLQLKQNERFIEDAQARVTNAERLCARLQRAALTAQRESEAAVIRAEADGGQLRAFRAGNETVFPLPWKGLQHKRPIGAHDDVDLLRQRQGVLEAERASLSAELRQHREDAEELAAKSVAARRRELQLRSKLEAARQRCTTEKREIEQRHAKEREAFVHEMQAELEAVAAATEKEVAMLTAQHEEEVHSLRRAEAAASHRHSDGASRSEAAAAESAARLQETQSLRRLCENSSGEVSRLSAELRAMQAAGFDLQVRCGSVSEGQDSADSEVERETDFFRARCESIERHRADAVSHRACNLSAWLGGVAREHCALPRGRMEGL
ncbi:unnamed protein product [Symbiodinium sp. CCMP2456]|nr:unnamed protein product [Symbiodinium sp. CCMP2456]